MTTTCHGYFLDFYSLETLPGSLDNDVFVSTVGTIPDGLHIDGPQSQRYVLPSLTPSKWLDMVLWADTPAHFESDYGYRLDWFHDIVDADLGLHVKLDDHTLQLDSDGIFTVNSNHADFIGDGTSHLETIRGLRDEATSSITLPLFNVVSVSDASYIEFRWTGGTVFQEPVYMNAGIAVDAVPLPEPDSILLVLGGLCLLYYKLR